MVREMVTARALLTDQIDRTDLRDITNHERPLARRAIRSTAENENSLKMR